MITVVLLFAGAIALVVFAALVLVGRRPRTSLLFPYTAPEQPSSSENQCE